MSCSLSAWLDHTRSLYAGFDLNSPKKNLLPKIIGLEKLDCPHCVPGREVGLLGFGSVKHKRYSVQRKHSANKYI